MVYLGTYLPISKKLSIVPEHEYKKNMNESLPESDLHAWVWFLRPPGRDRHHRFGSQLVPFSPFVAARVLTPFRSYWSALITFPTLQNRTWLAQYAHFLHCLASNLLKQQINDPPWINFFHFYIKTEQHQTGKSCQLLTGEKNTGKIIARITTHIHTPTHQRGSLIF